MDPSPRLDLSNGGEGQRRLQGRSGVLPEDCLQLSLTLLAPFLPGVRTPWYKSREGGLNLLIDCPVPSPLQPARRPAPARQQLATSRHDACPHT